MTTKSNETATVAKEPAKAESKVSEKNPHVYVGKDADGNIFYAAAGSKAAKNAERAAEAAAAESKAEKK